MTAGPTSVGDRIELIRADDPWTKLAPGDQGTVTLIDDQGTIHVQWDSGSTLGLIARTGDRWKVIS